MLGKTDKTVTFYFLSSLHIYPPDSQQSDGGVIHRASNYPDLLSKMPRCYCSVEFFIWIFSFIEI